VKNATHFSDLALANVPTETFSPTLYEEQVEIVKLASQTHFDSILQKVESLALQGYGSVEILLDEAIDMYMMSSGIIKYSAYQVQCLLEKAGFVLQPLVNHFDATTYLLIWNSSLRKAPSKLRM